MKQVLRFYALGILTATILIGFYYFYMEDHESKVIYIEMTEDEMITSLESSGYFIYDSEPSSTSQVDDHHETSEIEARENELADTSDNYNEENDGLTNDISDVEHYTLTIETGMTVSEITTHLIEENIISEETAFIDYVVENDYETTIQLGQYELTSDMTIEEIVAAFTN